MGVKSTVDLTRAEAEEKFVFLWQERKKRKARSKAAKLSNKELESFLEAWNDEYKGGEGFENYYITDTI